MLGFGSNSISKRLTVMNMLVSGAALLLAGVAFFIYDTVTFRETLVRYLSIQADIIGSNSVSALYFNDPRSAENTLGALKASGHIVFAGIYTPDQKPFAAYWRDNKGQDPPWLPVIPAGQAQVHEFRNGSLILVRSIVFQNKAVGAVYIESDLGALRDRLMRYAEIVASVLLSALLAAWLVSRLSQKAISEPLVHLAETANLVSREKTYDVRAVAPGSADEVATLILAFNEMLEAIHERDQALQDAQRGLEQRVKERTAALSRAEFNLRALSRRLLQTQDEERRRIARELHEGSGQVLAALTMNLSLLQGRVAGSDPEAKKVLSDSLHMVEAILRDLRTMSYVLHPPLLEDTGLESTLGWFVEGFSQRSQIPVKVEISQDVGRLPKELEIAIFRVVQESLTNVDLHAASPDATVRLSRKGSEVRLEVRDRGRGLPTGVASGEVNGIGIQTMQERVKQLGGRLDVISPDGAGTSVVATIPLPKDGQPRTANTPEKS